METAAAYAGVTARTVRNWMAKGKRESGSEFAEFRKSVLQAKAIAEVNDLEELKKSKDWCVIAWRMERRNPKAWGRKKVVMVQTGARRRQRTLEEISAEMDEILGDGHVSAGAGQ
jgi:succinate dehydrogenase flavin-adding protein (antitoxin of CptAB toxin-antitoxin module)